MNSAMNSKPNDSRTYSLFIVLSQRQLKKHFSLFWRKTTINYKFIMADLKLFLLFIYLCRIVLKTAKGPRPLDIVRIIV